MRSLSGHSSDLRAAGLLFALFTSGLILILVAFTAYALTPGLVSAVVPSPTSASPVSWAVVQIAKTTDTPTLVPTSSPTATPTFTPEPTYTSTPSPTDTITPSPTQPPPTATMTPAPTAAPPDPGSIPATGKYILVSISQQQMYAYENGQLAFSFVVSTGSGNSTRTGTFPILDKLPNAYADNWNFWMPDWMGIYWVGNLENGIHAVPVLPGGGRLWENSLGTPVSYGCVVLGVNDAQQLFDWAEIGTVVRIVR
jgi:lipoprotein-anchoring transpeptidase ErfK/SrfK